MRFHTSTLSMSDLHAAAKLARVELRATEHGSRTRHHAFEVKLRGNSRRRPNFYDGDGSFAATWDQWGVFMGYLFHVDPETLADKESADGFYLRTSGRFDLDYDMQNVEIPFPLDHDHTFRWADVAREQTCKKCGAVQRW